MKLAREAGTDVEIYDQEMKAKRGPDEMGQGSQRGTSEERTLAEHGDGA
jgi:hypothetical protein